jgi:hypothetical protein
MDEPIYTECREPLSDAPGICGNDVAAGDPDCGGHPKPCPVCSYGEPTAHTCDAGQRSRHRLLIRNARSD